MTAPSRVLVLTNEKDFAADRVIHHLTEILGAEVVRWNAEQLGQQVSSWTLDSTGTLSSRFSTVWLRQYIPEPPMTDCIEHVDESLILASQWRAWLSTLDDGSTMWMNPLWAARRAESKIVQLREAKSVGLAVPPTTVTSSQTDAAAFRDNHGDCVVKTLATAFFAHSDLSFVFTERLTDGLLRSDRLWHAQPMMVQRRVQGRADVRVVVVDDRVHAAELLRGDRRDQVPADAAVDWRLDAGRPWNAVALTATEADHCRALVKRLGLRYGAIDLIDDGEVRWFLEINQAGEFAFLDHSADLGVAQSIARALAGGV